MLRLVGAGQAEERCSVKGGADVPVGSKAVDHEGEAGPVVALLQLPTGSRGEVMPVLRDLPDQPSHLDGVVGERERQLL